MSTRQERQRGSRKEYPIQFKVNRHNELEKARKWPRLQVFWTTSPVPYIKKAAPMNGHGSVNFVLLKGGWVCNTCTKRVTISGMAEHALYHP